jgi:DNA-binding transcriptional regulator YhcF (GntR family)
MDIRLSKESEVPLRRQLAEQIIFSITTGKLRTGQQLPSVRALARLLKIHHNTVSEAYQDLVQNTWVTRQRGSRLIVGFHQDSKTPPLGDGLDDFINAAIRSAREMGFSLQTLRDRVYMRLLVQPADHILVVERDPGLREIMRAEIHQELGWLVEACSPGDLKNAPELAIGAQVAAPDYALDDVEPFVPRQRPCASLTFSNADICLEMVRGLRDPSVISVVSVSEILLRTARGLLAPALGRRHELREVLLVSGDKPDLRAADIAFCDSLVIDAVQCRRKVQYRLIAPECIRYLASMLTLHRPPRPKRSPDAAVKR